MPRCDAQEQQEVQKLIVVKQELAAAEERLRHSKGLVKTQQGLTDYSQDFFGKPTFLTVSGQLNAEIYATALSDVYTFGRSCQDCAAKCKVTGDVCYMIDKTHKHVPSALQQGPLSIPSPPLRTAFKPLYPV